MEDKEKPGPSRKSHQEIEDNDLEILFDTSRCMSGIPSTSSLNIDSGQMVTEMNKTDAKSFAGHLIESITDEVALEGLDGITIQALKVRLEARPNFDIEGFEDIASSVWDQIKYCKYFKFYMLPAPRPDLVSYAWDGYRDDRGNAYEPLHAPEEIYLYNPIDDKSRGVRGSCLEYETRSDITHLIRPLSYIDMIHLFGNRLVVVACQFMRERSLFGLNYKKYSNLTVIQYCIMERVGRSRYCGEITRGKISSSCMNIPPKTLFYMRKYLLQAELIKRQNVSIKFANCKCPAGVTVFHLPRFYKRFESMSSLNTRIVFSWLNTSATKSIPVDQVVSKYGKHTMRALTGQFPTLLETAWEHVPLNEGKTKKGKTRSVRVLKLKTNDLALQNQIITKVLDGANSDEGDDGEFQEEREEHINLDGPRTYKDVQILRPAHSYLTTTESYRLYVALMRSGYGGLTLLDIGNLMSLTPLESRSAGRFLTRHNACKEGSIKLSKQKAFTYILTMFQNQDLEIHLGMQEKFMFAMLDLHRIRDTMEERERKRIEYCKLRAIKAREIKEKQAEDAETSSPGSSSNSNSNSSSSSSCISNSASSDTNIISSNSSTGSGSNSSTGSGSSSSRATMETEENVHRHKKKKHHHHHHHHHHHSSSKKKKSRRKSKSKVEPKTSLICSVVLRDPQKYGIEKKTGTSNSDKPLVVGTVVAGKTTSASTDEQSSSTSTLDAEDKTCDQEPVASSSQKSHITYELSTRKRKDSNAMDTDANDSEPTRISPVDDEMDGELIENIYTDACMDEEELLSQLSTDSEDSDDDGEEGYSQPYRNKRGDSIDEQIRQKMVRQRVDWKDSEDRFILLAFIASSLFISKYNYNKVFIYNSSQIRDVMLKKYEGKSNKTSAAIRRRIHFLLHQQSRFENYIGLAGEALRDVVLYNTFIKHYMRPPQQKIYFNPPIHAFEAAVDYLLDKFAGKEYGISDSVNSLTGIDTLLFLRQLKRTEFFWKAVRFAIFCPMGDTSQSRAEFYRFWRNFSKMTMNCNSQNDDQYIDSPPTAMAWTSSDMMDDEMELECDEAKSPQDLYLDYCLRLMKFITKNCNIIFKNLIMFGSLNLKGFQIVSYDMSTANSNLSSCVRECASDNEVRLWTARCLVLDFIFSGDSSKLLEKPTIEKCKFPLERAARSLTRAKVLVNSKRTGLLGVSRHNLKNFVSGLAVYAFDEMLDFLKYLDEASTVDSLACISVGILHGIVELTDFFKTSITINEQVFTINEDWATLYDELSPSSDGEIPDTDEPKPESEKNAKPAKRRRHHSKKNASVPTAGSSRTVRAGRHRPVKKRRMTAEEHDALVDGLIDEEDECFEDIEADTAEPQPSTSAAATTPAPTGVKVGLEEGESFISSSNSNALRLLRYRLNQVAAVGSSKSKQVEKDFFTLNLPSLEFEFPSRSSLNHKIAGTSHPFSVDELKDFRKGLVELVYHRVPPEGGCFPAPNMEKILGKYTKIFEFINLTKSTGLSGAYLDTIFERKGLVKGLKFLIESKLVFSVGVAHRRYVTFNNVNDWVIPIRSQSGNGSTSTSTSNIPSNVGHVIMRPWLTSAGGLSWITISRLLTSLIGQLQRPTIPFDELRQVFAPTLSPVEATVLIEVLAKLNYLTVYRLKTVKPTLFSKPDEEPEIEYNTDTLVATDDVFVAISPYLTFLHSQLNQAIQKASKKQSMA